MDKKECCNNELDRQHDDDDEQQHNHDDDYNVNDVLRRRMEAILKYKEIKKIKDGAVSNNFKYFIKK